MPDRPGKAGSIPGGPGLIPPPAQPSAPTHPADQGIKHSRRFISKLLFHVQFWADLMRRVLQRFPPSITLSTGALPSVINITSCRVFVPSYPFLASCPSPLPTSYVLVSAPSLPPQCQGWWWILAPSAHRSRRNKCMSDTTDHNNIIILPLEPPVPPVLPLPPAAPLSHHHQHLHVIHSLCDPTVRPIWGVPRPTPGPCIPVG